MMIMRRDPVRDLVALQGQMNRLFGGFDGGRVDDDLMTRGAWVPPVDIYENDKHEIVLKAELPDVRREDIDLSVENSTLTLKGEKKLEHDVREEQFHRVERCHGSFSRTFSLPPTVDTGNVSATYQNGVLMVTLPLREEAKPRQIQVQVN